jgi:hypothetical protein
MSDQWVEEKLRSLIERYGTSLCSEPKRLEALLRDYCPHNKREVNVLLAALREQVPAELLSSTVPPALLHGWLIARLVEDVAMADEAAQWAVNSLIVPTAAQTWQATFCNGVRTGMTETTGSAILPGQWIRKIET